jgi:hypothetical protein
VKYFKVNPMKKSIFFLVFVIGCILLNAQVPQGFNYQALVLDNSGNPIRNNRLQVKISILSDTLTPVVVWEELQK